MWSKSSDIKISQSSPTPFFSRISKVISIISWYLWWHKVQVRIISWDNVLAGAENFFHLNDKCLWDVTLDVYFFKKKISFNFTIVPRKNRQGNKTGMPFFNVSVSRILISNLYLLYHYLQIKLIRSININHEIKWKRKNSQWHVKVRLFCDAVISQGLTGENGAEK